MKKVFVAMCVLAAISFSFHGWAAEDEDMGKVDSDDYFEGKKKIQTGQREEARVYRNSITVEYYPLPVSSEFGSKFKELCEKYTWGEERKKIVPIPIESAVAYRIAYQPSYGTMFSHLLNALAYLDRGEAGFAIISLDGDKKVYQLDLNYIPKPKDFISGRLETYSSVGVLIARLGGQRYIKYNENDKLYYLYSDNNALADFAWGLQGFAGLRLNLATWLALNAKAGYTHYSSLTDILGEKVGEEYEKIPSECREYSSIDLGGLTIKGGLTISF